MRFAVIGSSGFVGSSLVEALSSISADFITLDRCGPHRCLGGSNGQYFVDYSDIDSLAPLLKGVDCIFHLAGRAHQSVSSVDQDSLFWEANVNTLHSILKAATSVDVKRIVFVSSYCLGFIY